MASIYIHIPFCHHKCHYCNFFSIASKRLIADFTQALFAEIQQQKKYLSGQQIETVYFGGGTPSLPEAGDVHRILQQIRDHFELVEAPEITLEANPEDVNPEKLDAWKETGINRLSIGVQSFRAADLHYLGRAHTEEQTHKAIELALKAGFTNLSVDLIYGIPTLNQAGWIENLNKIIQYKIPHLSAYALTVEKKTALDWHIRSNTRERPSDELQIEHFSLLLEWADKNDFEQYEISNFCIPPYYSKHNRGYWSGKHYLGLGPSAHSFNGVSRQWNVANLSLYIQQHHAGIHRFESEVLTPTDHINEYIMTALRTSFGIDLSCVTQRFGETTASEILAESMPYVASGQLLLQNGVLMLTKKGKLFADAISASLFRNEG